MKMNYYSLSQMSNTGRDKLPEVLDSMGYHGRYEINDHTLKINSTITVVSKAIKNAEDLAHGERGHLVCIKQETYSKIWITESEADTQKEAFIKAIERVSNGWKVDSDAEISVKEPIEEMGWTYDWQLGFME